MTESYKKYCVLFLKNEIHVNNFATIAMASRNPRVLSGQVK